MTIRERAEAVAHEWWDGDWEVEGEMIGVIEAALKAERERAAKIVQSFDLSMWVKDGGKLREIFAEAILDENRTEGV